MSVFVSYGIYDYVPFSLFPLFAASEQYYLDMDSVWHSTAYGVGLNGALDGAPSIVAGQSGTALSLNGKDQFVGLGRFENRCFGNLTLCVEGYSLAFWITMGLKQSDSANKLHYFNTGAHLKDGEGIAIYRSFGKMHAIMRTSIKEWEISKALARRVWYHVVLTWKEGEGLKLYINGDLAEHDRVWRYRESSRRLRPFLLGKSSGSVNSDDYHGEVTLDDIAFWNRVITADMAKSLTYTKRTYLILVTNFNQFTFLVLLVIVCFTT